MLSRPLYIIDHSDRLLCPIPLKIEPYSGCIGACAYCSRSGLRAADKATSPQANSYRYIEKFFFQDKRCMERSLIDRRCPVQIGVNSDPLQAAEKSHMVTLRTLRIFQDRQYPTVLTTKFPHVLIEGEYLRVLEGSSLVVQCSVSTAHEDLLSRLEPGAPSLGERMGALKALHEAGAHPILRLWPFIPDLCGDLDSLLASAKDAGVKTVLANFLKIYHAGGCRERINTAISRDYMESTQLKYLNAGVYSIASFQDQVRELRRLHDLCHRHGLDLLNGDDLIQTRNWRCCCGTTGLPGFENVAKWAYYVNGWRITQHTPFKEYMQGHDCPWYVEFEQEWNKGKLDLPELIFNEEDKTYSRLELCV